MAARRRIIEAAALTTPELACICCGCTESRACPGGCSWAAVDEDAGVGLCSACAVKPMDQLIAEGVLEMHYGSLVGRYPGEKR